MNFNPTWLLLSLIPSGLGFVLFTYGRKQARWPQLFGGIALMVYPIFTGTVGGLIGGGAVIVGAMYYAIQAGW